MTSTFGNQSADDYCLACVYNYGETDQIDSNLGVGQDSFGLAITGIIAQPNKQCNTRPKPLLFSCINFNNIIVGEIR